MATILLRGGLLVSKYLRLVPVGGNEIEPDRAINRWRQPRHLFGVWITLELPSNYGSSMPSQDLRLKKPGFLRKTQT